MATGKHGNGEGSLYKDPRGMWRAALSLEGGKRKYLSGKTRAEVAAKLAAAIRDRDRGIVPTPERQTVGQFLTAWLDVARPTIKPRTATRYSEYVRNHAIPALGKISLAKLTPQEVQGLYAAKLAEGLSPTTVHHLHAVLHRALDQAFRWGLVARNVCDLVDVPRMAHHEMQVLAPEQARMLLAVAEGDRFKALYVLALTTGMRLGELLALHWRDIDLDARDAASLQIRGTMQRTKAGLVIGTPKTKQSQRRVALGAAAAEALRRHRVRQLEERLASGEVWDDQDLVFPTTVGTPMDGQDVLRREFYPLLQRASLPRIRFHDLRHTAATLLLKQGVHAKIVSEMLGHATIAITLNLYSHVLPDMQRDATAAMDRLLGS
jgi:integrase